MNLYNSFTDLCKQNGLTDEQTKAQLLYDLIVNHPRSSQPYAMEDGNSYDQYRLFSPYASCLLQATKHPSGRIEITLQGLTNINPKLPDFVCYGNNEVFFEYFEKLF